MILLLLIFHWCALLRLHNTTTLRQSHQIETQLWKLRALKQSSSPIIACTILKLVVVRIARSVSPHLASVLAPQSGNREWRNKRPTDEYTELTASHCDVWSNCVSCAPNDIYPTVYYWLSQLSILCPSAEEHCVVQLRVMLTHMSTWTSF